MDGKDVGDMAVGDEVGNLAVRIAGNVLQGSIACGTFVQSLDGNDREELVDRPTVGQGLEQGEVAEVFVCKKLI